jgi:hypothetical protein
VIEKQFSVQLSLHLNYALWVSGNGAKVKAWFPLGFQFNEIQICFVGSKGTEAEIRSSSRIENALTAV